MFIPIGHDQGELRRWPIVSFAIIGICVATFVLQPGLSRDEVQEAGERLAAALEYYTSQPDLQAHPRLQQALEQMLAAQKAGVRRQIRKQTERTPGNAAARQPRQVVLDRLTGEWLSIVARSPAWRWGLVPADFSREKLLTYMFIHSGLLHLVFNMLFLYMTGPFIEDAWSRPFFVAFYLTAGIVSALLFVAQDPTLDAPLVGASGAIAGVMGAFLVRYPTAKIKFLNFILFVRFTFSAPAWLMLPAWFVGELISARSALTYSSAGGMQVAYWAHVWGFAYGVAVGGVVRLLKLEERFISDAIERRREAAQYPVLHQVERLLKQNHQAEACQLLATAILRNPSDGDIAATYWHLARLGPMITQPAVCLRIIQNDLQSGNDVLALERWREFRATVPTAHPDIGLTALLARCLVRHGHRHDANSLLDAECRRIGPSTAPEVLVDLARFSLDVSSPAATEIVERTLAHPRVPPDAKANLRQALRWKAPKLD